MDKTKAEIKQDLSNINQAIAERVRMQRILKGCTQTDAAKLLGISFQQMQKYETGANRISAPNLFYLAQALDLPIEAFFPDQNATDYGEPSFTKRSLLLLHTFEKLQDHTKLTLQDLIDDLLRGAA